MLKVMSMRISAMPLQRYIVSNPDSMHQPWMTVFAEGEGEGEAAATAAAAAEAATATADKKFSQDDMNRAMAKEKRDGQVKAQKAVDELKALQTRTTLNEQERKELDTKIETLQNDLLSKEEQQKRAKDKTDKEHGEALTTATDMHTKLFSTYKKAETGRAVTDAAVVAKAVQPSQIVAILSPMTKFVPMLNEDETETGDYKTVIEFPDKDKDGNPVVMKFTATEALTRMKEMEQYFNLFEGEGTGGIGSNNRPAVKGKGDPADLAKNNPDEYIKQRRAGKIKPPA